MRYLHTKILRVIKRIFFFKCTFEFFSMFEGGQGTLEYFSFCSICIALSCSLLSGSCQCSSPTALSPYGISFGRQAFAMLYLT